MEPRAFRPWEQAMTDSRAEILNRIQRALGARTRGRDDDYQSIRREYVQAGSLGLAERVTMLVERLEDYDATVYRCTPPELSQAVARALANRGKRQLAIPVGLPQEWVPPGIDIVLDQGLTNDDLDKSDGVLTGCTVAIALTGTIVLTHGAAEGRRALTLVPDYHLCVVRADQIVETVSEGLRAARGVRPRVLTTISGPSATADIEMTRIKGVHGPRTLDVIIVG